MPVSKSEYQRITEAQSSRTLTIYIDTSEFRKLLVDKINPQKLSAAIREPVESRVQLIRILTYLDAIASLLAAILSLFAFGWLGILGILFAFALWAGHKMHACRGAQHILPVDRLHRFRIYLAISKRCCESLRNVTWPYRLYGSIAIFHDF